MFVDSSFKAIRTGVVIAIAGEFGIALLTLMLQDEAIDPAIAQPLLVAIVLDGAGPLVLANNKRVARLLLGERGPPGTAIEREDAATLAVAKREHVILCGFGRVGQNVARVLESQGFEYIAIDLDPARMRAARQVGDPVIFGDSADEQVLDEVGLEKASAVVITFADPRTSLGILRAMRRLRADVPVLVRTPDDSRLQELRARARPKSCRKLRGQPHARLARADVAQGARRPRSCARSPSCAATATRCCASHRARRRFENDAESRRGALGGAAARFLVHRQARGRGAQGGAVTFTGIRRQGILGREPAGETNSRMAISS